MNNDKRSIPALFPVFPQRTEKQTQRTAKAARLTPEMVWGLATETPRRGRASRAAVGPASGTRPDGPARPGEQDAISTQGRRGDAIVGASIENAASSPRGRPSPCLCAWDRLLLFFFLIAAQSDLKQPQGLVDRIRLDSRRHARSHQVHARWICSLTIQACSCFFLLTITTNRQPQSALFSRKTASSRKNTNSYLRRSINQQILAVKSISTQ
jgi:hypothetical protein